MAPVQQNPILDETTLLSTLLSLQLGSKGYTVDSHAQKAHPARRSFFSNTLMEGGRVGSEPGPDKASIEQ